MNFYMFQVNYLMVDDLYDEYPDLDKDKHWGVFPINLPYTAESEKNKW